LDAANQEKQEKGEGRREKVLKKRCTAMDIIAER